MTLKDIQEQQQIDVKAIAIAFMNWVWHEIEAGYMDARYTDEENYLRWTQTEEGKKLLTKPSQEPILGIDYLPIES